MASGSNRAASPDRLLDEEVEIAVVDRVGEGADIRPAVERLGHPGEAGGDGKLIVGQPRRAEKRKGGRWASLANPALCSGQLFVFALAFRHGHRDRLWV